MSKNTILDVFIICCIFLFLICFPIDFFVSNLYLIKGIQVILRIIFIVFILIYCLKKKIFFISIKTYKLSDLYFLPFVIVLLNNFIFLLFKTNDVSFNYDHMFLLDTLMCLVVSISEELLFRCLFFNVFKKQKPLLRIIYTSLIFSLFHLVTFLSTFNPFDLIQVAYTLFLGLLLGFIFEYTNNNFLYVFLTHFLFNYLNSTLFSYLYNKEYDYVFYVISILVIVISLGYGILIYLLKFRKIKKLI